MQTATLHELTLPNGSDTMTTDERASHHHAAIRANIDDWYDGRIDFDTFNRGADGLHAASRADGPEVADALRRLIVAALPGSRAVP